MKSMQHSYSSWSTFDTCPEQHRHLYILKDFKKSYTVQTGIDDHKTLERRLRHKDPLPDELAHAEPLVASLERQGTPEVEVSLGIAKNFSKAGFWDAWLRGKYDVIVRWPDARRAFVGDWKTGKVREASDQLEIGATLLMQNDESIDTVVGANLWLQGAKVGLAYIYKREDQFPRLNKWFRRMTAIEQLDPSREWEKRESGLCGYCPVQTCPNYRGG